VTPALSWLNASARDEAAAALLRCCGSTRWVERVLARRPFSSLAELHAAADAAWSGLERADHLEAFSHHPRLGADPARLRERFGAPSSTPNSTHRSSMAAVVAPLDHDWSAQEQSGVAGADDATLEALRTGNAAYEARFGFVFLVCATGKGALEVLTLLEQRIGNDPETELGIAAAEHAKITHLRLEKLSP
jgi:2-oxo-4-hydroxy-4-carboxy-5-ureidoimidazoline decarboxylase